MFKSAVIRLTIGYIGAITLICLMFSIPVYTVVSDRLRVGAERQSEFIGRTYRVNESPATFPELIKSREQQLAIDRRQLLSGLVIINLCIIVVGGYLSYLFARQTLKPIKDAHQLQKSFTANASHELRTPLAVIQAESEVALRNKGLNLADAKETIASSLEEVSRLQAITGQLLSLTKIGADAISLKQADAVALVESEVKLHQKATKLQISINAPGLIIADLDKTLFRQAVGILLDNAIKYSSHRDNPDIKVTVSRSRQNLIIKVSDNGVGIPKSDRSRIFDRFYRGKTVKTSDRFSSGNGLGLAIAQQIILQHGGQITLDKSVIGKGSIFSIRIPLSK